MKTILLPFLLCSLAMAAPGSKPLKIFILAGQSNMEGHAMISTFDYIGDDPATAPLLGKMRGPDGRPTLCGGAWISYLTGAGEKNFTLGGPLTAGYGAMNGRDSKQPGEKIGPEFTFGLTMDEALDEPVLLIKTAWGGKSLHTDFRPPGSGPFEFNEAHLENLRKQGRDPGMEMEEKRKATGHYYRMMIDHVRQVLGDLKNACPAYDPSQGHELAGFVWLQGFNDMVDGQVYPKRNQSDRFDLYSVLLEQFIRDVRKDLAAPKLPFVIGVMGVGGLNDKSPDMLSFRRAMAAPASRPEFRGNVAAVQTAPFWSDELGTIDAKRDKVRQMRFFLESRHKDHANADGKMSEDDKKAYLAKFEADLISPAEAALWKRGASNAGYHYLGCAKTFALMGRHFAEAALVMMGRQAPAAGRPQ